MLPLQHFFSSEFNNQELQVLWNNFCAYYCAPEEHQVSELKLLVPHFPDARNRAAEWITAQRNNTAGQFDLGQLLHHFNLNTDEGLALMSMAESLLRIPDSATAYALLEDKLDIDAWEKALGEGENTLLTTSIWGLAIGKKMVSGEHSPKGIYQTLKKRLGKSATLHAMKMVMRALGENFVFAENIHDALAKREKYNLNTRFSFDMLGEGAVCQTDSDLYFQTYRNALESIANTPGKHETGISIKLSALHPRFENQQNRRVNSDLFEKLTELLSIARKHNIPITIDAEEADKLELTLGLFKELIRTDFAKGWGKLGIAIQASSKRAIPALGWLEWLGRELKTDIPIRLVKGSYWDAEIKQAQQHGLQDYPVYTLKAATDISYLVCARFMLSENAQRIIPAFATHNALTVAQIYDICGAQRPEFQRLHGMSESLHRQIADDLDAPCKIYAPVGNHKELLPYLVRRLLENSTNSAFIFHSNHRETPIANLLKDPLERLHQTSALRSPKIPLPMNLYAGMRKNSSGLNFGSNNEISNFRNQLDSCFGKRWKAGTILDGELCDEGEWENLTAPHNPRKTIGKLFLSSDEQIKAAYSLAEGALPDWQATPLKARCEILERYAKLLEKHQFRLIALCIQEAGKCLKDAADELREAIDFCYYYSALAEKSLQPQQLPAVAGETNQLEFVGRGIFVCISPWNFPLAVFTGQICAALVSGNTVLAKPSAKSSLVATLACKLWYEAGLPTEVLSLVPFKVDTHSRALLYDYRLAGVVFTGSISSAEQINRSLAERVGAQIPTFIAETGGQNAMIADSTALPEQLVKDVIRSAFSSAGQRCSATRVLYIQEDIADTVLYKLIGAMNELRVGDPTQLSTDIGPVISRNALDALYEHLERYRAKGQVLHEVRLNDESLNHGYFMPPSLIEIHTLDELTREHFGPILHIIRFPQERLDQIISQINRSGYGLTLGIHSRNNKTIQRIASEARVGNIYVNRDQIGAIVGAQPFGGMGYSGTGPKAGGPHYLQRFIYEKTTTINTSASGGKQQLMMDHEDF